MRAGDVMTTGVVTISPDTKVPEIAALLIQRRISAVPVLDGERLVGIVSEGDLMRRPETRTEPAPSPWLALLTGPDVVPEQFRKAYGMTARDVMTPDVVTVSPETPLDEVARLLESKRIKRVPVMERGRLVGILSRANLLHGLVAGKGAKSVAPGTDVDRQIRAEVQQMLARNAWLERDHVNLVVQDGVVHVWGIVRSEEHRQALHTALHALPGVRRVEDHLSPNWFANTTA